MVYQDPKVIYGLWPRFGRHCRLKASVVFLSITCSANQYPIKEDDHYIYNSSGDLIRASAYTSTALNHLSTYEHRNRWHVLSSPP